MLMLGISIGGAFNVTFGDWMVAVLLIILEFIQGIKQKIHTRRILNVTIEQKIMKKRISNLWLVNQMRKGMPVTGRLISIHQEMSL
ncbi:hypothetical protein SUGI_0964270 [Cryptomeria japonica]|nr:hypothetical protein SUGI_0964270 [Cryptomeria japonica]